MNRQTQELIALAAGLGAGPFVRTPPSSVSSPLPPVPSRPTSPYSSATPPVESASRVLERMKIEQPLPTQTSVGSDYQWATLNTAVTIGGHTFPAGTRIVVSMSQTSSTVVGKAHTKTSVVKVWAKFGQTFDSSNWVSGTLASSTFTLTGQSATWSSQTGFGAGPHGGGGHGGGGGHHGGGGGGFHRRVRGGRGWVGRGRNWIWGDWGPSVVVYNCPPGYYYDLYGTCVPCPPGHYVDEYGRCLPLPGFSGPPVSHGGSLPPRNPIPAPAMPHSVRQPEPHQPVSGPSSSHATSTPAASFPSDAPMTPFRGPRIPRSLGMDYTATPAPGDYHVSGNGVTLRAGPKYTSSALATLQNGENVHVFGDVETDPDYFIQDDDTVEKNTENSGIVGIDYVRVGTQTHGAGWIAMPYIEPGAGTKFGAPNAQPQPGPAPAPAASSTNVWPWVLGGSLVVLGGGAIYLLAKTKPSSSRTAPTYRMRTA